MVASADLSLALGLCPWAEHSGYRIRTTQSAREAAELVGGGQVAGVIIDLSIPRRDGMGLRNWLAKLTRPVAIVALGTAYSRGTLKRALAFGVDAFVLKPYEVSEVQQRLSPALAKDAARRARGAMEDPAAARVSVSQWLPRPGKCGSDDQWLTLDQIERDYLRCVLEHTDWNAARTSRILGISRRTVVNKMKRFGLHPRRLRRHG